MKFRQQQEPRQSQNRKAALNILLYVVIGGGLGTLAVLGILHNMGGYGNSNVVKILINQTKLIGSKFVNFPNGDWVNEGECHYLWDITNDGTFSCGNCESGVSYFNNRDEFPQTISGAHALEVYDAVLENEGDLYLYQQLRVRNSFRFEKGQVVTDKSSPGDFLHFVSPAVYSGESGNTHVNGYAGYSGKSAFTFPVGDGSELRPARISGTSTRTLFKAAYFRTNPALATLPIGAPFDINNLGQELEAVHSGEYWDIRGSGNTSVTLYWDSQSDLADLVSDLNDLVIAGWNGSEWVNLGQLEVVGSMNAGRVKSSDLIPDEYDVFTFGAAKPGIFPVDWSHFSAERVGEDGHLIWVTSSERNSSHFDVERSLQSAFDDFVKIGEEPAQGNSATPSSYLFIDPFITNLPASIIYYRIRQVDLAGQFSYSPVRQLYTERDMVSFTMNVFPNPAREYVMVRIGQGQTDQMRLQLIDMRGRLVFDSAVSTGQEIRIDLSSYAEGAYVVKVQDGRDIHSKPLLKR